MNDGIYSTLRASIRESVQGMAVGRIKSNEKADHETVEQAIDHRTQMVLFKLLDYQLFNDINGRISTGQEVCCYL